MGDYRWLVRYWCACNPIPPLQHLHSRTRPTRTFTPAPARFAPALSAPALMPPEIALGSVCPTSCPRGCTCCFACTWVIARSFFAGGRRAFPNILQTLSLDLKTSLTRRDARGALADLKRCAIIMQQHPHCLNILSVAILAEVLEVL